MYIYWQYMESTLSTVTCKLWAVNYVQLLAGSGENLMYIYRQKLDSTLCTVTSSIWTGT